MQKKRFSGEYTCLYKKDSNKSPKYRETTHNTFISSAVAVAVVFLVSWGHCC